MYWCGLHTNRHDIVVAICDENILEKEFESRKLKVKIKISKNFYGQRLINEEMALRLMKKATIGNIIGSKIVELARKNGFITKENVILIDEVPHAQFVKI